MALTEDWELLITFETLVIDTLLRLNRVHRRKSRLITELLLFLRRVSFVEIDRAVWALAWLFDVRGWFRAPVLLDDAILTDGINLFIRTLTNLVGSRSLVWILHPIVSVAVNGRLRCSLSIIGFDIPLLRHLLLLASWLSTVIRLWLSSLRARDLSLLNIRHN